MKKFVIAGIFIVICGMVVLFFYIKSQNDDSSYSSLSNLKYNTEYNVKLDDKSLDILLKDRDGNDIDLSQLDDKTKKTIKKQQKEINDIKGKYLNLYFEKIDKENVKVSYKYDKNKTKFDSSYKNTKAKLNKVSLFDSTEFIEFNHDRFNYTIGNLKENDQLVVLGTSGQQNLEESIGS